MQKLMARMPQYRRRLVDALLHDGPVDFRGMVAATAVAAADATAVTTGVVRRRRRRLVGVWMGLAEECKGVRLERVAYQRKVDGVVARPGARRKENVPELASAGELHVHGNNEGVRTSFIEK